MMREKWVRKEPENDVFVVNGLAENPIIVEICTLMGTHH
jgi:hypothetical protein